MTQAERNEAVAGALGTLELGGRTYLVSQPDDRTFASIHKEFRKNAPTPIKAVSKELEDLPPQYRATAIKAAVELTAGGAVDLSESFIREQLQEPRGCAFLVYLLVKPQQPDVTLETIVPFVTAENLSDILVKVYEASGMKALVQGKVNGRTGSPVGATPTAPAST
jgi:hypothetical protein